MEIFGYLASILIGVSLGLIGGGGSILAVPILVYLFKVQPEMATSYSLFIVGITTLFGAVRHHRMGNLKPKVALYFGLPSIISLLLVRKFVLPSLPQVLFHLGDFALTKNILLMLVFALLMVAASVSMIRKQSATTHGQEGVQLPRLVLIGFLVGIVTGFLGAGGGFLIIPALLFFAGLNMKEAVGTSLLIIFVNSMIGFSGDLLNGVHLDLTLLLSIALMAILGMLIGTQLSKKIQGAQLKPAFGWFVLVMGIYIIVKEMFL